MADLLEGTRRDFPTLAQWLGDGARADGFEDFLLESVMPETQSEDAGVRSSARIMRILAVAFVEAGRREDDEGLDRVDVLLRMARGCGVAMMAAFMSIAADGCPAEELAKHITSLFRQGAELFIENERAGREA